jgi:hypothetical protein
MFERSGIQVVGGGPLRDKCPLQLRVFTVQRWWRRIHLLWMDFMQMVNYYKVSSKNV